MGLTIKTTGIEDYVDGSANIRMLVVGSAGAGKTRMSSFWPRPIYADCEGGRGSLADRNVPYTEVKSSQDMLDFLQFLKDAERTPKAQRQYQTVVIDTLDGFQRKVFDERLQQTKKQTFAGYEDWGYLDSRMQLLMTRLLNLDYNVICLVHYKEKGGSDDQPRELQLHLKGDIRDSAFYDFDLVGFLGSYFEAVEGERVEKRGLTFSKTADRPWAKDRYGVMPKWAPVTLTSEQDYEFVRDAFLSKLDQMKAGEVVGEIPSGAPEGSIPTAGVVAPTGGPLPPQDPRGVPLHQFDKPTIVQMCKKEGVTSTVDGVPFKGNTTKAELIQALEAHRAKAAEKSDASSASPEPVQPEPAVVVDVAAPTPAEVKAAIPEQREETTPDALTTAVDAASALVAPTAEPEPETPAAVEETATDTPTEGAVVEPVAEVPSTPAPAETASVPADSGPTCEQEGCDVLLSTQSPDWVKLSFIRFKKKLCGPHYQEARSTASA